MAGDAARHRRHAQAPASSSPAADDGRGGPPIATPLLFVGNNRYSLDAGRLGEREALDDGKLSVFAVAAQRRRRLVGFVLRTLAGRADPERDFALVGDTVTLTVDAHARTVAIALDGEVLRLATPLHFEIDPNALAVVAPLEGAGATP